MLIMILSTQRKSYPHELQPYNNFNRKKYQWEVTRHRRRPERVWLYQRSVQHFWIERTTSTLSK